MRFILEVRLNPLQGWKTDAENELDVDYVLVLDDYSISGAKIAGKFTDYVKLMFKKHCYNGIKIEGGIIYILLWQGREIKYRQMKYKSYVLKNPSLL